jgi:DNA-binding response OmpR family regulator
MARILVVDDDRSVRAAIKIVLEVDGFEVVTAEDGRAGKQAAEAVCFDAAIVDLFMPEMDSLLDYRDALEPPPDYLAMATALGAVTAVQKPFQPRELLRAVRESIREPA